MRQFEMMKHALTMAANIKEARASLVKNAPRHLAKGPAGEEYYRDLAEKEFEFYMDAVQKLGEEVKEAELAYKSARKQIQITERTIRDLFS